MSCVSLSPQCKVLQTIGAPNVKRLQVDSTPVYSCYAMGLFGGPIDTRWLPPVTGQNPPCPTVVSTGPFHHNYISIYYYI